MFAWHLSIGKEIRTWESQDEFGDTNMLVDSMEMGDSLSRTLGQNSVALMRGHGCVCAAADIRAVIMISVALKDNANLIHETRQLGEITYLTDGEIDLAGNMLLERDAAGKGMGLLGDEGGLLWPLSLAVAAATLGPEAARAECATANRVSAGRAVLPKRYNDRADRRDEGSRDRPAVRHLFRAQEKNCEIGGYKHFHRTDDCDDGDVGFL